MNTFETNVIGFYKDTNIFSTEQIFSELHKNEYPYPHYHTYYEVHIVINGSIEHSNSLLSPPPTPLKRLDSTNLSVDLVLPKINFNTEILSAGDIQIVPPNLCHSFKFLYPNSEYINITISKKLFNSLTSFLHIDAFDEEKLPMKINIASNETEILKNKFLEINDQPSLSEKQKGALNKILLLDTLKHFLNQEESSQEDLPLWIRELVALVNNPMYYDSSISDILSSVPYSRSYICREFKNRFGISFKTFLTEQKMKHACHLLKNTDVKIISIANMLGYSNPGFFADVFQQYYSVTPSEYRKRSKGLDA